MPDDGKPKLQYLTRRESIQRALAAGTLVGLAGCNTSGEDPSTTASENGDTTEQQNNESPDEAPEYVSNRLQVLSFTPPEQVNLNPWAANPASDWVHFWTSLGNMMHPEDAHMEHYYSGHSWDLDYLPYKSDSESTSVTVPTVATKLNIVDNRTYNFELNDQYKFWNGEPIDAKTFEYQKKLDWLVGGGHLSDEEFTNGVAVDDYTLEFKTQQEQSQLALRMTADMGESPRPKSFTKSWVETLMETTTQSELDARAQELGQVKLSLEDFAEDGMGNGLYRIESADDVNPTYVDAHLWEEHPNAPAATVPSIRCAIVTEDRQNILKQRGEVDLWSGIIDEQGKGNADRRGALPDYIQDSRRIGLTSGGQLQFDWKNEHLQNVNVRRAIVCAADFVQIEDNWSGAGSRVLTQDSGLTDAAAEEWLDEDFRNNLITYPKEADQEQATEYMEMAGYTKEGGQWHDPNGNPLTLPFTNAIYDQGWVLAAETFKSNLDDFGIPIELNNIEVNAWIPRRMETGYGLTWMWYFGGHPLNAFTSIDSNWEHSILRGVADAQNGWDATEEQKAAQDHRDNGNRPLTVTVPKEVGAAEITDGGEEIDLLQTLYEMRQPGVDTKEQLKPHLEKVVRWYNYGVPDFRDGVDQISIVRNVRDFNWPADDHPSYLHDKNYFVKTGLLQGTTDNNYE